MSRHPPAPDATTSHPGLAAAAARALELVETGTTVGLGSGRAASVFIEALGERVRSGGLAVRAVPSSETSADLARRYGIPLVAIDEGTELALIVDGADEVSPELDLVKGRGGAMVRERIITAASFRQVILIGPEKRVQHLGEGGPIPIEVIPLAEGLVTRRLRALGLRPTLRREVAALPDGPPFVTENGNLTFDCALARPLADGRAARALQAALLAIPGVVDTGLFLGTAERVIIGHDDGRVDVLVANGGAS